MVFYYKVLLQIEASVLLKIWKRLEQELSMRFTSMLEDLTSSLHSDTSPCNVELNGMGPRNVVTFGVALDFPAQLVPNVGKLISGFI